MPISSKEMEEGFKLANEACMDYLKGGKTTGDKARIAQAYLANATRLKVSETNSVNMKISFLSQIAKDKDELKRYVQLTSPDMLPSLKSGK